MDQLVKNQEQCIHMIVHYCINKLKQNCTCHINDIIIHIHMYIIIHDVHVYMYLHNHTCIQIQYNTANNELTNIIQQLHATTDFILGQKHTGRFYTQEITT